MIDDLKSLNNFEKSQTKLAQRDLQEAEDRLGRVQEETKKRALFFQAEIEKKDLLVE